MIDVYILGVFLVVFSWIDIKNKAIPSIFLTGVLFVFLALHPTNLFFGVLSAVFALFLFEINFIGGVADVKVISMIGLLVSSLPVFAIFVFLITFFGTIYKLVFKWRVKDIKEIPFIPALLCVYTALFWGGLL